MSDTPKDGGPAFPQPSQAHPENPSPGSRGVGMSLRAYFAGQAFKALTQVHLTPASATEVALPVGDNEWDTICTEALRGADAMLAKLKE